MRKIFTAIAASAIVAALTVACGSTAQANQEDNKTDMTENTNTPARQVYLIPLASTLRASEPHANAYHMTW